MSGIITATVVVATVGLFIGSLFLIMQFSADQMYLILIGVIIEIVHLIINVS